MSGSMLGPKDDKEEQRVSPIRNFQSPRETKKENTQTLFVSKSRESINLDTINEKEKITEQKGLVMYQEIFQESRRLYISCRFAIVPSDFLL